LLHLLLLFLLLGRGDVRQLSERQLAHVLHFLPVL
jgi:hypothetical protein